MNSLTKLNVVSQLSFHATGMGSPCVLERLQAVSCSWPENDDCGLDQQILYSIGFMKQVIGVPLPRDYMAQNVSCTMILEAMVLFSKNCPPCAKLAWDDKKMMYTFSPSYYSFHPWLVYLYPNEPIGAYGTQFYFMTQILFPELCP